MKEELTEMTNHERLNYLSEIGKLKNTIIEMQEQRIKQLEKGRIRTIKIITTLFLNNN